MDHHPMLDGLPIEIVLLAATMILAIVNLFWAANARTKQYGTKWNVGARDEQLPPIEPLPGRLLRAQANLMETLPLFAAAVLAATAVGRLGQLTAWGAHLYFFGRLIYLPLYAMGTPVIRTVVWMIAMAGLLMVIAGIFCR
ncbi:MAPEG family protein [Sphingomonas oryzagri]|uniref:MAPEG family protein n=1 Tax=Sphingomonas oryzagri TaxID=3042314 RepID=A0ABT6N6K0_9SPHN|nr:MAPEG family protein [Sphingomonas oryzagri]MDH7640754.1 MAPEG family protein [Sphingomonas oryzagri]